MGLTRPRAAQIFDLDYKQATRVITVANVTLAGGAPAVVDGVSLVLDDRVLVTGQTTASQNGLYDVTVVGVGSDGTWVRTSDANATGEILAGMIVMVTEGTVYADTQWKLTTDNPIIIGTTGLTFVINILSSVGGANTQVQVNDGGTLAGFSNFVFDKTSNILSVTGNISGNYFLGNGSQLTGIASAYGNTEVAAYLSSGNVTTAINTTSTISATGNITGANINGNGSGLTSISGANVTGIVATATSATTAGTVTTAAQPNITSVGTLTSVSVTGNITAGNLSGTSIVGTLTTAAQTNITSVGTLTSLNSGAISSNGTVTGTSFVGIATSARYADLAENYLADAAYASGTVVEFGGNNEVTVSTVDHSTAVAGVVSTDPAYLMNSDLQGVYIVAVALTGRVPCLVQGPVKKGSVLVTGTVPGTAMAIDNLKFKPGCVVGKAMEPIEFTDVVTIEVAVGRL